MKPRAPPLYGPLGWTGCRRGAVHGQPRGHEGHPQVRSLLTSLSVSGALCLLSWKWWKDNYKGIPVDSVPVFRDVCVCVCVCVFSGRQVSLDLVLRWTYNSVCVCVCVCTCTNGLFFALLLRVANSRKFWWLHREQFKVRGFSFWPQWVISALSTRDNIDYKENALPIKREKIF